jgi:hypothetical protein
MFWWRLSEGAAGNQGRNVRKNIWREGPRPGYASANLQITRKSGAGEGFFMKLRTLFLAAIALVVLAGAVVPANAKSHHRHHHHSHHHR